MAAEDFTWVKEAGFFQFRCDCCLYGKYRKLTEVGQNNVPNNAYQYLDCLIILNVDDVLYVGNKQACGDLGNSLKQFGQVGCQ